MTAAENTLVSVAEHKLYKNHGKSIGWWSVTAVALDSGAAKLLVKFAKTMGGAVVEKDVPIKGMNIGRANETTPVQQAIAEAQSRVKKQIDKGYVVDIADAAAPATDASGNKKPMKAKKIGEVEPDYEEAFSQPKLDGHRTTWQGGKLLSTNGIEINLPHLVEAIEASGAAHLLLDGELYCHGISLQMIGSLAKKPREESLQLDFHIFDLINDKPFAERHVELAAALGQTPFSPASGEIPGRLRLVSTVRVDGEEARMSMHRIYMGQEYEGSMLRWGRVGYADGKRSPNILKGKDMDDDEFTVTGYEEATPIISKGVTYRVPVWIMDVGDGTGRTFKATAHGTKFKKNEQWEARDSYVGQRNVVRHFGFTPDGIPDLPVSKCWESDKNV